MRGKGYLLVISVLVGFYIANKFTIWLLVCLIWLALLFIWFKRKKISVIELTVLILVAFFFSHHFVQDQPDDPFDLDTEVSLVGKVTAIDKQTDDYTIFTIKDPHSNEQFQVNDFTGLNSMINVGATCQVTGNLQLPDQATNPGQFNYQKYLSNQNIYYQIVIDQNEQLYCEGINLIGQLQSFRQKQLAYLTQQLSEHTASWTKSLVLGNRAAIDDDLLELFQRWHLTHLLSISGLHISILVVIIHFTLIHVFRLTKESTYQLLIIFLLLYPFMAGGAPSIWRASIVSSLNYLAWYHRHRVATIDFLSISFVLLLLIKPDWIYHLGFQFSYLITFSILLSKKILAQISQPILIAAYITGLSILMTIPIQVSSFYIFNPYSFFLNVFATLYFSIFFIPIIFITYLTCFVCPPLMRILDMFIEQINGLFLFVLTHVDQFFYRPIITGSLSPLFMFLFYLTLFYLLAQFERKKRQQSCYAFICLMAILMLHQLTPYFNPYGKVTTLDVGQSDTLIIELPYRRGVILYDVGATLGADFEMTSDKVYQQIIKPYLYQAGISQIDGVILSHEDHDHIGSLAYLLNDFSVQTLITSVYFQWPESIQSLLSQLDIDLEVVSFGQSFNVAEQEFFVLGPSQDWGDRNDNSLVLYTMFSNDSWLLTGDISERVEKELISNFPKLSIDTLSVPHHGSATSSSSTFLEVTAPNNVLISVGRNNFFNHPNEQVISRLEEANFTIYRTDQNGAIQFIFHNSKPGGTFLPFIP
ncbi:DNA internalization-related competence protein ComEC/Rec2 [Amphibacillus sp. Q70]|uniref:DNA internalization-related competence protein ComEC/Rec2 n=1 Tax=Amphibacillus sp. Q70 TaxID=3453416 RepID=UPI003F84C506